MEENKAEEKSKDESPDLAEDLQFIESSEKIDLLKREFIKKIDLFGVLPPNVVDLIAHESKDIFLEKDQVLFKEGYLEKKMYIIMSGCILICKGITAQKRIAVLGAGEYLGEMALVDSQPRSATAVALSDTLVMEISEQIFRDHITTNSKALMEMMKVSTLRIRKDLEMITDDMQKISNFTHDMRNCLVPLGVAEILLTDICSSLRGTEEYHKARSGWEKVKKSFDTMLSVKNNVVTLVDQSLACVQKAKTEYNRAEMDVLPLIEETVQELACHKFLKGKKINIQTKGDPKRGFFNYLDIKRVLQNLLINAGYVTKKDGQIDVNVKHLPNTTVISVKDYGKGIPEDIKSLLLKESITTKPDGYGFGLMSCREIIEDRHQEKIYFETEEGKGTEFHFTLGNVNE